MDQIREIHRQAMEIVDEAYMARRLGDLERAKELFIQAFELEFEVAQKAITEPSRSVLLRGAATLALHAELYREAERAAAMGLAGNPPPEIADELRAVLEKSNLHRQLATKPSDLFNRQNVSVEGQFLYADAINNNTIKILDDMGKKHTISVSDIIAEDVVRIYFGKKVIIRAIRNQKQLLLQDIQLAQD